MVFVSKDEIEDGAKEVLARIALCILLAARDIEQRLAGVSGLTADSYATTIAHAAFHKVRNELEIPGVFLRLRTTTQQGRNLIVFYYEYEGRSIGLTLTIKRLSNSGIPAVSRTRQAQAYLSQRFAVPEGVIPGLVPDNVVNVVIGPVIGPDGMRTDHIRLSVLDKPNKPRFTFAVSTTDGTGLVLSEEVAPYAPTGTSTLLLMDEPHQDQRKGTNDEYGEHGDQRRHSGTDDGK